MYTFIYIYIYIYLYNIHDIKYTYIHGVSSHILKMQQTRVLVIGAGVSGLKAASDLSKSGLFSDDDIIVVEAQNRIGGRIKTDRTTSVHGVPYDLGGAWFHDYLTNSVLRDCIKDGSFDVNSDGYFDDKDCAFFSRECDGQLDMTESKLVRVGEDIDKFIELHYAESLDAQDMPLPEIVDLYYKKYGAFLTPTQKQYAARLLRFLELWYGISHKDISAKYAVMDHQGRNFYNKKGYSFVIDKLARSLRCRILLEHQVSKISRDVRGGLRRHVVEFANGQSIAADYLVVSVPQSILQLESGPQAIHWAPPLPESTQRALKSVHFGALGKVVLEFDHIWWDNSQDRFTVLSDSDERIAQTNTLVPSPWQYPIHIVNYGRVFAGVPSLVILIQSPVTDYLEANPDKAWEYMKPMVAKMNVGKKEVPDPAKVMVTDWTQNPFARGAYSAVYPGDSPDDLIINLSGEFDMVGLGADSSIRFAGEHTIAEGAGCIHGAYDSGTRAASWIIKDVSGNSKL